jgi:hypothetical protein
LKSDINQNSYEAYFTTARRVYPHDGDARVDCGRYPCSGIQARTAREPIVLSRKIKRENGSTYAKGTYFNLLAA